MHEFAITSEIVKIVREAARGAGDDARVKKINLKIGKFSSVVIKFVQHYYDIMTENTNLHGAIIDTVEVETTAECRGCGNEYTIADTDFSCPKCGGGDTVLLTGRELFVESIELHD